MIENLVDRAIVALLSSISGLTVEAGIEDNEPLLLTPYCVVHSVVESVHGKTAIYELVTTVEYVSISGQDTATAVEATMTAIDLALTTQPTGSLMTSIAATLATLGLQQCQWEHIPRTQQEVGDRRKNVRELKVFAQLV